MADFTEWKPLLMQDANGNGTFNVVQRLRPGDYQYKFIVDGEYTLDPRSEEQKQTSLGINSIRHVYPTTSRAAGKKNAASSDLKKSLDASRKAAENGKKLAQGNLVAIRQTIKSVLATLQKENPNSRFCNSTAAEARNGLKEQFDKIKETFYYLPDHIECELKKLENNQENFTIVLFGRTMAGKSTMMEILTEGNGSSIGKGAQRTTRDIRSYYWNGLKIVDVPGICATDGADDEEVAYEATKSADMVIFLITDDAPQPSESAFFDKIRSQGKPIVGIINVKEQIDLDDPDVFFEDLSEKFTSSQLDEIETQFNQFLQAHSSGKNIRFIRTHLKARYEALLQSDTMLQYKLREISNFRELEARIIGEVSHHGTTYRMKSFLDAAIKPMLDFSYSLLDFSLKNARSGRLLLEKKRELSSWKDGIFLQEAHRKISDFASSSLANLRSQVSDFAEENCENSSASQAWMNRVKHSNLEQKVQHFQQSLLEICAEKIKDLLEQMKFEQSFAYSQNMDHSLDGEPIFDSKRAWNWSVTGLGAVLVVAAFWWNPAGWIALGVGIIGWLGSLFFDDHEQKRREARSALEHKLREFLNRQEENLEKNLLDFLHQEILKNKLGSFFLGMQDMLNALFSISDQQKVLARSMFQQVRKLNVILLQQILECKNMPNAAAMIHDVVRIPGKMLFIVIKSGDRFPEEARKSVGIALKESVWFLIDSGSPEAMLRQAIGKSCSRNDLSYEGKAGVAHLHIPQITPVLADRIRLAEQLTGIPVIIEGKQ